MSTHLLKLVVPTASMEWKYCVMVLYCTSLSNSVFRDTPLVAYISHHGNTYTVEIGSPYKSGFHSLLCWSARLKEVMEKMQLCKLNLEVCHVCSHNKKIKETFFQYAKTIIWFSKEITLIICFHLTHQHKWKYVLTIHVETTHIHKLEPSWLQI